MEYIMTNKKRENERVCRSCGDDLKGSTWGHRTVSIRDQFRFCNRCILLEKMALAADVFHKLYKEYKEE